LCHEKRRSKRRVVYPDVFYARRTITARTLNELVDWLKANKASAGIIAGDFRLITMSFQRQISATLTLVPYRGGAPAVQDLAAGQIDILIATPLYLPLVRAGSIKAFAVTTDALLRSARTSDLYRDRATSAFLLPMDRPFRTEGHAGRHHQQAPQGRH
jgi:tripartite-type tricarboxylate transporter receptor subunit TctC